MGALYIICQKIGCRQYYLPKSGVPAIFFAKKWWAGNIICQKVVGQIYFLGPNSKSPWQGWQKEIFWRANGKFSCWGTDVGRAKKFKSTRGLERRGKVKGIQAITGATGGLNKHPYAASTFKNNFFFVGERHVLYLRAVPKLFWYWSFRDRKINTWIYGLYPNIVGCYITTSFFLAIPFSFHCVQYCNVQFTAFKVQLLGQCIILFLLGQTRCLFQSLRQKVAKKNTF